MIIYNNQSGLTDVYLGNTNIAEVYIGDEKVFPTTPSFDGKWKATYSDSHVESAECGSSSEIIKNEIAKPNLVSVEIGDCVRYIGSNVFQGYTGLTSVTIPNSVTYIGSNAFFSCRSLTSINIPSGVTTINSSTFQGCSSLTSINIPSGVTSISSNAFDYCSSITGVTIPSGVTYIGMWAFDGCSSLQNITVEATTPPALGGNAFNNTNDCPIYVPCESVNAYKSASGWSDYTSRIQCIEPTPTGDYKLKITYPNSIVYSAECDSNTELTQVDARPSGYEYSSATMVEIGECITSIGNYALMGYSGITSVYIPNTIASIGTQAFMNNKSLTSITIPDSVTEIKGDAFNNCISLSSVAIPDSVTSVGSMFLGNCNSLTSVTIGSGITSIGNAAFMYDSNLQSITINAIIPPSVGNHVFDGTNNCIVYVPAESVNAYKTAWSDYSSRIQPLT